MKKVSTILTILLVAALLLCGCTQQPTGTSTTTADNTVSTTATTATTAEQGGATTLAQQDSTTVPSANGTNNTSANKTTETTVSVTTTATKPTSLVPANTLKLGKLGDLYMSHVQARSDLNNAAYKLFRDEELTVAYIGGSVTDGTGVTNTKKSWRELVGSWLQKAYPNAKINNVKASVGGTGSGFGMYRFDRDVLSCNPDLIFIEFAVNDYFENYNEQQVKTQIETMYRKAYAKNPYVEIVMLYVSDTNYDSDRTIPWHEAIASAYNINSIRLDACLDEVMSMTRYSFDHYLADQVHPNEYGYEVYANAIINFLQTKLKGTPTQLIKKSMPAAPVATVKTNATIYLASETAYAKATDWSVSNTFSWVGSRYGGCITTTKQGATLTVRFKGTDLSILWENAQDIGEIEYSVDGGAVKKVNGNLSYSNPKELRLAADLADGEHTVTIRFVSEGKRCAIGAFLVAGTLL